MQHALEQLPLHAHRHVLASAHREGPGQQTADARQEDHAASLGGPGEPHDQRDVGHEPVVDSEDRRSEGPALPESRCLLVLHRSGVRVEPTVLAHPALGREELGEALLRLVVLRWKRVAHAGTLPRIRRSGVGDGQAG